MSATLATPAPLELGTRLLATARTLVRDRRPAEALPMLDRLRALADFAVSAAALRAEALLDLNRLPEAEAAADQALAEDAEAPELRQLRARIRLARGAKAGAIDDAAAAVMALPGNREAKLLLAATLVEDGRCDEAIWFLGEALREAPEDAGLKLRLAHAFVVGRRHDAAEELLAHLEAVAPAMPGLQGLRAHNALMAGEAGRAAALARAALDRGIVDAALHSVLGHAEIAEGRLDRAGPHFAAAARLAPGDGYLAHLAAAAEGLATARATDSYVAAVFDGYAPHFESSILGLGYRVPGLLRRAVERHLALPLGPVLDLGCGTGLVGVALSDLLGSGIVGVDLSPRMLAEAAAKQLYAELAEAEIGAALATETRQFALITAADVFCYLGPLEEVLRLCRARLAPGGLLGFSVELAPPGTAWRLGSSGRYAHGREHVEAALAAAGLAAIELREEDLRLERDAPVRGLLVLARADA